MSVIAIHRGAPMPGLLLALAALAGVAPLAAASCTGCSQLTPAEGALLQGADVLACAALSEVPVVGGMIATACPGEELAVAAAIAHAEAQSGAGVGAGAVAVAAHLDAGGTGLPLYRCGRVIGRCPYGYPAHRQALAQAHIDAAAQDGGW